MKNCILLIAGCLLVCVLFMSGEAWCAIGAIQCGSCHTIHNSQGGSPMTFDASATPVSGLLRGTCIGCHTSTAAGTYQDASTGAPIVYNTSAPTYGANGLAAGNFYYVSSATDNTGHNVISSNTDGTLSNTPPGGTDLGSQITCAGTYGCHGHNGKQTGDTAKDDQSAAVKGGHHGASSPMTGSIVNVNQSYRFLLGIKGVEDTDWQQDNVNTSHNEYQGSTSSATDTISYLCSECHGNYHRWVGGALQVGTASPWYRHPTDIVLTNSGEYTSYTSYSMTAPLARPNPSVTTQNTVASGTDILMCLSCHRAHASPYYKMMRWDYKNSTLSTALAGCNICHTGKN